MKKNLKFAICALSGACLVALTGCQSSSGQNGGWEQSDSSEPPAEAVQEGQPVTDGAQENGQVETEQGKIEGERQITDAAPEQVPETETVEYSHGDMYLSVDIPDGWGYRVRSAEELEKEDGLILCAIDFWSQEYPAAVFSLEYMPFYGICGTGVTSTEFTLANGLGGWRHTEEIEDTLWLNIYFNNVENVELPEAYLIEATPDLKTWDAIQPEFEEILESVWVGARFESAGGTDASQTGAQRNNGQAQSGNQAEIGLEEAKEIALADAGVLALDVTFTKEELDYDDGIAEYEIEFVTSTTQYKYDVRAKDGIIAEALQIPIEQINSKAQPQNGITLAQAKTAALENAGVTEAQAAFSQLELDYDDGVAVYEIEFYVGKKEYSYTIDASTGKILESEMEWD